MSPRFIRPKVSCKGIFVISLVLGLLFFSGNSLPVRLEFDDEDILDLSHPFNNQTVYYPTMEQLGFTFQLGTVFRGLNKQGNYHSAYWFQAAEHGGTHVDAPSHNQINGTSVENIALNQLIGPAVVVDISQKARRNVNYEITVEDLQQWEERHGKMPKGSILLICSGWAQKWPNRNALFGTKNFPDDSDFHFPGFSPPAAKWLIKHRSIKAIGTDGPSVDSGPNQRQLPIHQLLSTANILIIEFIANLDKLPAVGATVLGLPMKIEGGSAAPLRLIAFNWQEDRPSTGGVLDKQNMTFGGSRKKNATLNTSASSRSRPSANVTLTRPTVLPKKSKELLQHQLKITSGSHALSPHNSLHLANIFIFIYLSISVLSPVSYLL